jgi:hypothetical protein
VQEVSEGMTLACQMAFDSRVILTIHASQGDTLVLLLISAVIFCPYANRIVPSIHRQHLLHVTFAETSIFLVTQGTTRMLVKSVSP